VSANTATAPATTSPGPVAHHFNNLAQQQATQRLGMWAFLVTEVLFFGGVMCAYTVYRIWFPKDFEAGSAALNVGIASVNTFLLLTSSLTIMLAIRAAYTQDRKGLMRNLVWTTVLGTAFLGLKAREYYLDYKEGLIPNNSSLTEEARKNLESERAGMLAEAEVLAETVRIEMAKGTDAGRAAAREASLRREALVVQASETPIPFNENLKVALKHATHNQAGIKELKAGEDYDPSRVQLFFMFYYSMTGLHVLHMIVGLGLLIWQITLTQMGFFNYQSRYVYIETMSLYWHFVDMVWMFLLPLLYLCGPHTASQAISQFLEATGLGGGGH
jgi:cytochrome c oxidase subunit 3